MTALTLSPAVQERRQAVARTVSFLKDRTAVRPTVGLILGSGLGDLVQEMSNSDVVPYRDIPGFPVSTAPGHAGNLVFGELAGKQVVAMQGRFHTYEGYTQQQITYPVRVMKALGVDTLLVSCACGGLNPRFQAGDLLLITDHLNLTGGNPLVGPNDPEEGPRFPVMFDAYKADLRTRARTAAAAEGISLQEGVYAAIQGPAFFSPAELRHLITIGADAIGMSTVPEVITAVHAGLKVVGLAVISDMALPDADHHATEQEILATMARSAGAFRRVVSRLLPTL